MKKNLKKINSQLPKQFELKLEGSRLILYIDGKKDVVIVTGSQANLKFWMRGFNAKKCLFHKYTSEYCKKHQIK